VRACSDLLREVVAGRYPSWLERLLSAVGRTVHRHDMIHPGDRILVGVSGGKDSLATALALALRRSRVRGGYDVAALMVDWIDFPAPAHGLARLREFFELLEVPFEVLRADPAILAPSLAFSCYSCARARKRLLFEKSRDLGYATIAFGHHLDDFAATALMNLCFRGRLEPLAPVRDFFDGSIKVIRPLCEVRESSIRNCAERLQLPVLDVDCPFKSTNLRLKLRPVVADLAKMDKLVRENIYKAWFGQSAAREE
jgi:tRNA 2-thiocytidine biosynthesis protein TtcA